ncbi:kinase-like domain-containing protein [Umbelopsis sp. AD052]|nr:kinase-like domain-containing protein [Umbelopsis sp. AD052]
MESEYHLRKLKADLAKQTLMSMHQLIEQHSEDFDLQSLVHAIKPELANNQRQSSKDARASYERMYKQTRDRYEKCGIDFDDHWHWTITWRQAISYKALGDLYGVQNVVENTHPRAKKAITQIFQDDLSQYMRWYPWRWFSNMQFIGCGGFSAVYSATLRLPFLYANTDLKVALKIVDDKVLNEIAVQSRAFLALLFSGVTVCETTGDLMMVMTYAQDGNLEDHFQQDPLGDLDLKTITGTITRVAINIASLHDEIGMCHRNIHPRNVICAEEDYFLVDYRFSTASNEASTVTQAAKAHYGRLPFIAPEVSEGIYTEKSDIYSLGIIIWQLVAKVVFPSPEIMLSNPEVYRIEPVPGVPKWYEALYTACLEPNPANRPDADEICSIVRSHNEDMPEKSPLDPQVAEYVNQRRKACDEHLAKTAVTIPGSNNPRTSTTRVYTLASLPPLDSLVRLHFTNKPFDMALYEIEDEEEDNI